MYMNTMNTLINMCVAVNNGGTVGSLVAGGDPLRVRVSAAGSSYYAGAVCSLSIANNYGPVTVTLEDNAFDPMGVLVVSAPGYSSNFYSTSAVLSQFVVSSTATPYTLTLSFTAGSGAVNGGVATLVGGAGAAVGGPSSVQGGEGGTGAGGAAGVLGGNSTSGGNGGAASASGHARNRVETRSIRRRYRRRIPCTRAFVERGL
jgi:hypothetical protein